MLGDLSDYARARVGTSLSKKYRLERLIGTGGMASVYEAAHRNGLRVAIKILHPHLSIDADLRARFLREGYVANKVKHRGAVRVLDDDSAADGSVFLVMELLEGETLDALFQRRGARLPLREVCELADQLLDTLAAAHDQQVVHRDIKPENLFLTTEAMLKVLDFGIARLREANGPEAATRTGRMIGTPAFMPPEQALGRSRQIDARTDLWAVAATMLTLASGQFVHDAETMEEMLICAGSRPARSLHAVLSSAPAAIASVVDRALAFPQEQRWPDARAMRAALGAAYREAYGAGLQVRSSQPAAFEPTAPTVDDPRLQVDVFADKNESLGRGAQLPADAATQMATAWTPPLAAAKRISTTAGLAHATGSAQPPRGHRDKTPLWAVLSLLVLLSGGATAWRALRSGTSAVLSPPSPSLTTNTGPVAVPPSGAALDPASIPASATTMHANSVAQTVAVPAKSEATTAPAPVPRRPAPMGPASTSAPSLAAAVPASVPLPSANSPSTPVATATASALREETPPPSTVPSCRIVTSYDNNGQPHFKKICN